MVELHGQQRPSTATPTVHNDELFSREERRESDGEIDLCRRREGRHGLRTDFCTGAGRSADNSGGVRRSEEGNGCGIIVDASTVLGDGTAVHRARHRQAAMQWQNSRQSPKGPWLRVPLEGTDTIQKGAQAIPRGPECRPLSSRPVVYDYPRDV